MDGYNGLEGPREEDPRAPTVINNATVRRPEPELTLRTSVEFDKIAAALAKAQGAMTNPSKDREVQVRSEKGNYKFKYATLAAINDVIRAPLAENGIYLGQAVVRSYPFTVVTRLIHGDQWIEGVLSLEWKVSTPQTLGSLLSYLRRYSIVTMLNLASDDDDDANIAEGNAIEDQRPAGRRREAAPASDKAPDPALEESRELFRTIQSNIRRLRAAGDPIALREMWEFVKDDFAKIEAASGTGAKNLRKEDQDALKAAEGSTDTKEAT